MKDGEGMGPFLSEPWSGERMEPRGGELVEDRPKKLSSSENFPALHLALHNSNRAPRDRRADHEPAASQLLKPSPACQQPSSQQVPSPALHRCSTGADQSLAAAPATPSHPTDQNFIFFKKINNIRMHRERKNFGQNSKKFSCRSKYTFIRLKNCPKAY